MGMFINPIRFDFAILFEYNKEKDRQKERDEKLEAHFEACRVDRNSGHVLLAMCYLNNMITLSNSYTHRYAQFSCTVMAVDMKLDEFETQKNYGLLC